MTRGYWIIIYDGYSQGLVLINPRFFYSGRDPFGNPRNWWPKNKDDTRESILKAHQLKDDIYVKIIYEL